MMWLFLVPVVSAYELNGYAWPEERLPVEVHWTGTLDGLTHDELRAAVEGAAAAWTEAGPCSFGIVAVEDAEAEAFRADGGVAVLFGDPADTLDGNVLMASITYGIGSGETFTSNGMTFEAAHSVEIVVNDHAFWASDGEDCTASTSLQGRLTHALGHVIGLDNACGMVDEPCSEEELDAIMGGDWCDTALGADDVAGLEAIYGPAFAWSFGCTISSDDALTADCAVTSPADAGALGATWDFGDGGTGEGPSASHTYAEGGTYEIEVCVQPPDCSDRRCQTLTFVARFAADDTGAAIDTQDGTESGGCGCATRGSAAFSLVGLVGLVVSTRRRVLRSSERPRRG